MTARGIKLKRNKTVFCGKPLFLPPVRSILAPLPGGGQGSKSLSALPRLLWHNAFRDHSVI